MSPVTHFLSGWVLAHTADFDRRDRAIVTLSCVVPDIDGLGIVAEVLTRNSAHPLTWFSDYHHLLHNLTFALLVGAAAFVLSARHWKTALSAFLAFHVHLLEDVVGSRGRADDYWAIPYFLPFSDVTWTWSGRWVLNSWQNICITALLLGITFWLAYARGYSPLEMISRRADLAFVGALRRRFARWPYFFFR